MKLDWSFPRHVGITLVVTGVVAGYPLAVFGTPEILRAVLVGACLATLNVLAGYASIEYAIGKSTTTFMKVVLGWMGLRLVFLAGALTGCILLLGLDVTALMASLGGLYVIFLTLEIFFLQKKVSIKQEK